MNAKEEVIAMMRSSVTCGIRPGSSTLTSWANALSQAEQQTPPSPDGRDCAGESSVQPTAPNPIGLRPRWVSAEHRLREITAAMQRYYDANKQPPFEWLEEMSEIIEWKRNRLDKKIQAMQDAEHGAAG